MKPYRFMVMQTILPTEFALTPAGTKLPGQVTLVLLQELRLLTLLALNAALDSEGLTL